MLKHDRIRKTEEFLLEKFDSGVYLNTHQKEKAYRIEHTYRVANIGRQIALKEGFDETEMVIVCLLHDLSYCEDFAFYTMFYEKLADQLKCSKGFIDE